MSPRIELAPEPFVATNVSNKLLAWADATHRRRRIAIVSGPPGIGKTESVMAFQRTYPKEVAIVNIGRKNASPTMTLRETAAAIRAMDPHDQHYWMPSGLIELRQCIHKALCSRAGIDHVAARAGQYAADVFGRLTVVVDEAQNLSREAIEMLRFWNDRDNCYAPMPIGFVFVGNNEFALRSSAHSPSILSAAVADRAIYTETLGYSDVEDDDLERYAEARGVTDRAALKEIVRHFSRTSANPVPVRSLQRLSDALGEALYDAGDGPVTAEIIGAHLKGLARAA